MYLPAGNPSPQSLGDKGVLDVCCISTNHDNQTNKSTGDKSFSTKPDQDFSREFFPRFSDLFNYALVILFLVITFFTFRSFSATILPNHLGKISVIVERGEKIIVSKLATKINWRQFATRETLDKFGIITGEFINGARRGVILSKDNIIFSGGLIIDLTKTNSRVIGRSITNVLLSANNEISKINKTDFVPNPHGDLPTGEDGVLAQNTAAIFLEGVWSSKKISITRDGVPSNFSLATILVGTEQSLTTDFSGWLIWPGFVPVVFSSYFNRILPYRNTLNDGIWTVIDVWDSVISNAYLAWDNFLNKFIAKDNTIDLSNVSLREQLKQEILQELQKDNSNISIKNTSSTSMYLNNGIVLMKTASSTLVDLGNIKKIQDSFSDRVLVNFDRAGQTGIIQPIFRDHLGEKYIFVVTPTK
jgi:hypothetical protein